MQNYISFNNRMLCPERHAFHVLLFFQFHTWSSLLLSQSISHNGDWVHWCFKEFVLWLYRNDSIIIIDVLIWIDISHGLVLLLDLLLWVQNQIQILGRTKSYLIFGKVSSEDWELFLCPGLVNSLEQLLILWRDFNDRSLDVCEVLNKHMLAKRRIPVG